MRTFVIFMLVLFGSAVGVKADLVFTYSANPSDTVVNWSISGSATSIVNIGATSSGYLRLPTIDASPSWEYADVDMDGTVFNFNTTKPPLTGSITMSVAGAPNFITQALDVVDFFATNRNVDFDIVGDQIYPAIDIGETFEVNGSGTFTLSAGTFGTVFNLGSYTSTSDTFIDGSDIVVNVVPEPSTYAMLALASIAGLIYYRRKKLQVTA